MAVEYHTHTFPVATKAETEAGIRNDVALSPASLFGATLPIAGGGTPAPDEVVGGIITIGPTAPLAPSVNDVWIDTSA